MKDDFQHVLRVFLHGDVQHGDCMDNVCDKLAQLSIPRFSTRVARYIGINLAEIVANPTDKKLPRDLFQYASFMVFSWMYMGFPSSAQMLDKVQGLHVVLAAWIRPWGSNKCRSNREVWNTFTSTSIVLALHRMVTGRSTKHRFTVMARAFAPRIQEALLQHNFEQQSWRDYCEYLFNAIWDATSPREESCVYQCFNAACSTWYVGKANLVRREGQHAWCGFVVRFREHVTLTIRRSLHQSHRQRYKMWAQHPIHAMLFVPVLFGDKSSMLHYEIACIRLLQPPTQTPKHTANASNQKRHRPFPRFRQKPDLQDELRLNALHCLQSSPGLSTTIAASLWEFTDTIKSVSCIQHVDQHYITERIYERCYSLLLILYLAVSRNRLDYKKVWKWRNPLERLLELWHHAQFLDHTRRCRVRSKLERFMSSARLLPVRLHHIKVPVIPGKTLRAAKVAISYIAKLMRQQFHPLVVKFLLSKLRLVPAKMCNLADQLSDQVSAAKKFKVQDVQNMPAELQEFYNKRRDVFKLPFHVHIPVPPTTDEMVSMFTSQLYQWCQRVRLSIDVDNISQAVSSTVPSPRNSGRATVQTIIDFIRQEHPNAVFVPLDRDIKRRAAMDLGGYWYRLFHGYIQDSEYYALRSDLSLEDAAKWRQTRMEEMLPEHMCTRRVLCAENMPNAYHNYKGKCLHDEFGGLQCDKSHSHEREVISAFRDPLQQVLQPYGRALRLAKKYSGEECWTLWDQSKLTEVLHEKVNRLRYDVRCINRCPCGKQKLHPLGIVKVDASQFFKSASTTRCIERSRQMFQRLQQKLGVQAIAVRKTSRSSGFLVKHKRKVSGVYRVIRPQDILQAMRFAAGDNLFVLGDAVVERKRGWAMGNTMSSAATCIDLEHEVFVLHNDRNRARELRWTHGDFRTSELVQGLQHVDDAIVFSKVLCGDCLWKGMQKLWPTDVGITLESSSSPLHGALYCDGSMRFLHARVSLLGHTSDFLRDVPCYVQPYMPNAAFASGTQPHPHVSHVALFVGSQVQNTSHIQNYLWCKLSMFDKLVMGSWDLGREAVAQMVAEVLRLLWPCRWVASSLHQYPRHNQSCFACAVRKLGQSLRRQPVSALSDYLLQVLVDRTHTCD